MAGSACISCVCWVSALQIVALQSYVQHTCPAAHPALDQKAVGWRRARHTPDKSVLLLSVLHRRAEESDPLRPVIRISDGLEKPTDPKTAHHIRQKGH